MGSRPREDKPRSWSWCAAKLRARCRCLDTKSVQLDRKWSDAWPRVKQQGIKSSWLCSLPTPALQSTKAKKEINTYVPVETKQEALGVCGPCRSSGSYLGERMNACFVLPYINSNSVSFPHLKKSCATATAKSLQSCLTLCDPIDRSPPGSPILGILQARTLEWVAISFSNA